MTVGDLPGHEMLEIKHPDFPLLSSCRLVCLIHFALRTDTWLALGAGEASRWCSAVRPVRRSPPAKAQAG
jgi:hypothetical protein